ncbi:MAG: hypothetical protein ACF8TS_10200 [Maioricimonas sp. JB049]
MRSLIPITLFACGLTLVTAGDSGLQPAYEVHYDSPEDREEARRQAREIVLQHLFREEGGFPAEDRLIVRGEAFRIGYAIDDFCSEGDVLMFVFRTSLRSPVHVRQVYLVNSARRSVKPIR